MALIRAILRNKACVREREKGFGNRDGKFQAELDERAESFFGRRLRDVTDRDGEHRRILIAP